MYAQDKVSYTPEERKELGQYLFDPGFKSPASKKVSTLKLKDGTEIKGFCKDVDTKKGQIYEITFLDTVTDVKKSYSADQIAEASLFQSTDDKLSAASSVLSRGGMFNALASKRKKTSNGANLFVNQKVSLKNKKEEREFLMQLINPEFDDLISVYFDPFAAETKGMSVGGFGNLGGGVIKSYYVKKGDKVIWLQSSDFKEEYEFLFGDNADFMKKYPYKSVKWEWFGGLVLNYTKMKLGSSN
jgi:hypothetical protein